MASMALPGFPFERRCQLRAPSLLDQTDPATTAYRRSGLLKAPAAHRHDPLQAHARRSSRTPPVVAPVEPGSARQVDGSWHRASYQRTCGEAPAGAGPAASGSRRRGRGSKSPPRVRVDRQRRMPRRMPGPSGSPAPRRPSRARRFASATTRCQSRAKVIRIARVDRQRERTARKDARVDGRPRAAGVMSTKDPSEGVGVMAGACRGNRGEAAQARSTRDAFATA